MTQIPRDDSRSPANAMPVFLGGSSWQNIIASQYTQLKTGHGVLSGISINTGGTTSAVILYDGVSSIATMTIAAPGVITWANHPFVAGQAVVFETTGALPTGLTAGTAVYVSINNLTANTFEVADTAAHALAGTNTITTSGSQSGVHTGWDVSNPIGTFGTTTQNNVPIGLNGAYFALGLIALTSDGGGAANITAYYA
jgi:hypothetical protein